MRMLLSGSLAALTLLLPCRAQQPPAAPASPPASPAPASPGPIASNAPNATLFATDSFVYVLRGDVLWQLDVRTLAPVRTFTFPAAGVGAAAAPAPTVVTAPAAAAAPAAPAAAAAPAAPPLPPPRAAKERAAAVHLALQWLAKHQDQDGRWDCDAFFKHDDAGTRCDGPGNAVHDVGATGLAVLALLADGSTPQRGQWKDQLQRAADWLRAQQQHNGLFGTNASHDFVYDHAIAAYAMCELYGSGARALQEAAQKGLDYLESHRNPYSVWRYQPRDNDNDTSVTTWAVLAFASGRRHGMTVNVEALKLASVWYDQVSDSTGMHGYSKQGEPSSRKPGDHAARFPPERGDAMTAAAAAGRFAMGQTVGAKPVLQRAVDRLLAKLPRWERTDIDPVYWFFGARAMQAAGAVHHDTWQRALDALLPVQRRDGSCAGSWDPIGVWDDDGGRVVSTALCALALQAGLPPKLAPEPK